MTCEHGGNRIPGEYHDLFRNAREALDSHRGYDAGALVMARHLARHFDAPLVWSTVSRLVVDLNRSIGHRDLYSEASRALSADERARLLARYYSPYRERVEAHVAAAVAQGRRVIHISSHSFTPVLHGVTRGTDVGLLYDPSRPGERALCRDWTATLEPRIEPLRVRRNDPYQGRNDGLTRHLRRRYPPGAYVGVELEVNQRHVARSGRGWHGLRNEIVNALAAALRGLRA